MKGSQEEGESEGKWEAASDNDGKWQLEVRGGKQVEIIL